eukprot:gene8298-9181_t
MQRNIDALCKYFNFHNQCRNRKYFNFHNNVATENSNDYTHVATTGETAHSQIALRLRNNFKPIPPFASSPVILQELHKELSHYPDQNFAINLLNDFTFGFNIGYCGPQLQNISTNLKSTESNESPIADHIISELKLGRLAGPFTNPPLDNFRTSPIGVVPKKDSSKLRMITDLSSPKGLSINDFIDDNQAAVSFSSFDTAARLIASLGRGSQMAKLDVKSAFLAHRNTYFSQTGVPLAPEKIVGPATSITFLGIEIDSTHMCLKSPQDKLCALQLEITSWFVKKKCTQREPLSLIGKLCFAAKIIPSGRTFLRRLIDLSNTVKRLSHHISINTEAQQDIAWWAEYLPAWNGKYKILDSHITYASSMQIFTDASGQLGFGIFCDGHWISEQWPHSFLVCSIQWKELFPIYVTCFCLLWGHRFSRKRIIFIVITRPLSIFGVLIPQNAYISCIYCVNSSFSRPKANTPC